MLNINNNIELFLEHIKDDYDFLEIKNFARKNRLPIIKTNTKDFLKIILSIKKPKKILEIGTCIAYSTLIMAKYTSKETSILSIEKSKENYEFAKKNIEKENYSNKIKLMCIDAKEALNNISQGFDFIFIDANKSSYKQYFDIIKKRNLLKDNGIIICDNVLYKGYVCNDDLIKRRDITIVKRLRIFLNYITELKGYNTVILNICDGISITIKEN